MTNIARHFFDPVARTRLLAEPSVLVATSFGPASGLAVRRGQELARVLGARLVLLHVRERETWVGDLFRRCSRGGPGVMQRLLAPTSSDARSRAYEKPAAETEHDDIAPLVVLRDGPVAANILRTARDVHASVIVLGGPATPPRFAASNDIAADVIRLSNMPVLIARSRRPSNAIVAATNFSDLRFPALRKAAKLGATFESKVTFLHNHDGRDVTSTASFVGNVGPSTITASLSEVEKREAELAKIASLMGDQIDTVVRQCGRSADAILGLARERDADLVVVGARPRRRLRDVIASGTALTVARESQRSVLTVPLFRGDFGYVG